MNRILQIGAFAWIISEGMEIYSGGYTVYNSSVSTTAFLLIAIGILSLFRHETLSIVGKVGAICVFASMLGFTWIAFKVIGSDVVNDLEILMLHPRGFMLHDYIVGVE
ncbi:MAG: hypothetical protein HRU28_08245 [Rhizobiales bacterium]|nr:hypothetical protein [Hyphomicrobiales bacterium]